MLDLSIQTWWRSKLDEEAEVNDFVNKDLKEIMNFLFPGYGNAKSINTESSLEPDIGPKSKIQLQNISCLNFNVMVP